MILGGEKDTQAAIITIHPGAGGTESQDWAQMLYRMYSRWIERKGIKMDILDAFKACTYTSAKSLMLEDTLGSIEEGKKADIIIWEVNKIEEVSYSVDFSPIRYVIKNGSKVFTA